MYDDISYLMYYCYIMENFKNFLQSFGFAPKKVEPDPMAPSYIKEDGTKVVEQVSENGKVVYEISPNGLLISRSYTKDDKLYFDYARKANYEIGHSYDQDGRVICEVNSLYNEHNKLVKKTEIEFKYHDNGAKSQEISTVTPGNSKVEIHYDEKGELLEKIVHQGTVKTWYDKNNKPFKREIDRGSGGIITENL